MEPTTQTQLTTIKASALKRLTMPSPDFFIKVQKWCIFLGFACGTLSAWFLSANKASRFGLTLSGLAGFIGVFGTLLAKLPIDEQKTIQKIKGEEGVSSNG